MKKSLLIFIGTLLYVVPMLGQSVAIKNNLLYDAALTPNIGLEFGISPKSTINIHAGYNPFEFGDRKQMKHWVVQPEYRYWLCDKFNGTFLGLHLHGGEFSVSNMKLPFGFLSQLEDHLYEGVFYGAGISIGHQWILSRRWNIEASIGAGFARIDADKYPCAECGSKIKSDSYNYFGPTKASISLVYFLR